MFLLCDMLCLANIIPNIGDAFLTQLTLGRSAALEGEDTQGDEALYLKRQKSAAGGYSWSLV